jgi:signal transduction histidine kinase
MSVVTASAHDFCRAATSADIDAAAAPDECPELAALARVARQAVGADTIVVEQWSRTGSPSLAAQKGLDSDTRREVHVALMKLASELSATGEWSVPQLAAVDCSGTEVLLREGFGAALSSPLDADGRRVGTLYALKRREGKFVGECLISVFARQAAIAVTHRQSEPGSESGDGLHTLDLAALSCRDFSELVGTINLRVAPLVGARSTGLMVWDERRRVLQMVAGSFGASEEMAASYQIRASDRRSNAARVFNTGQPYMSNVADHDPGILQDYASAFHIERLLSLPLELGSGRYLGVLHLANKATDFNVEDVERAGVLAQRVAILVEISATMFELRRQRQLEGILSGIAVAVAAGENLDEFLLPALEEVCVAIDASMVTLISKGSAPLIVRRQSGHDDLEQIVLSEAADAPGIRAYAVGPTRVGDPGWAAFHAPMQLGRQRIGTLAALRVRGEPFTIDERHALRRVANLAALAWASEHYQQQRAELARLQERQRIADELHDHVAQILFGAQLQLDEILQTRTDPSLCAAISSARGLLVRGDAAIRSVIHQLERPVQADLTQRITTVVSGFESECSLPIHLEIAPDAAAAAKRIGKPLADVLVKVLRESLTNATKHAGPCRVQVSLRVNRNGRLVLTVVDDGLGVAASSSTGRHGLRSLRRAVQEQGGSLRLNRGCAGGAKVLASFPL